MRKVIALKSYPNRRYCQYHFEYAFCHGWRKVRFCRDAQKHLFAAVGIDIGVDAVVNGCCCVITVVVSVVVVAVDVLTLLLFMVIVVINGLVIVAVFSGKDVAMYIVNTQFVEREREREREKKKRESVFLQSASIAYVLFGKLVLPRLLLPLLILPLLLQNLALLIN